jgi:ATP-dependent exoDNAse (exonuclease V) alpha subunit
VQVMTENPYRLSRDIRGIGFKTADAIAMKLGIAKTAMSRVRAGISHALAEAMDEGHCGLPTAELVPLAGDLLEVDRGLVQSALDLELAEGTVVADKRERIARERGEIVDRAVERSRPRFVLRAELVATAPQFIGKTVDAPPPALPPADDCRVGEKPLPAPWRA